MAFPLQYPGLQQCYPQPSQMYPQGFPQSPLNYPLGGLQQPPQMSQQQQPQQIQNGGFVYVQNEEEARNYPVAPGNSVTFKDENSPYMYAKTMGFSQLDRPIFEKYRLIKENAAENAQNAPELKPGDSTHILSSESLKSEIDGLTAKYEALRSEVESIRVAMSSQYSLPSGDIPQKAEDPQNLTAFKEKGGK